MVSRLPEPVGRACIVPEKAERMITAVDCTICSKRQILRLPFKFNAAFMSGVVSDIPREVPLPRASADLVLPGLYFLFVTSRSVKDMPEVVVWAPDCSTLLFLKYCKQERWLWLSLAVLWNISSSCPIQKVRIARSEAELSIGISPIGQKYL